MSFLMHPHSRSVLDVVFGQKAAVPGLSALAPLLGLSSNLPDDLGLYGRALHLDLHCGVECPPGFPQLPG